MSIPIPFTGRLEGPSIERVRREPKLRSLIVRQTKRITPHMLRLTLGGDELADFESRGFDDHVKLLMPSGERRDYTPRRFDPIARTLTLDFAVHEGGPATAWAMTAAPGDAIQVAGPKGSTIISPDVRQWTLIGDETALPAIGRRIEEADADTGITSIVAVTGAAEEQTFDTLAKLGARWVHRASASAADPCALIEAVRAIELDPESYVWIAAEARVARAVRDVIVDERGHRRSWTKAGGYWVMGRADAHERIG